MSVSRVSVGRHLRFDGNRHTGTRVRSPLVIVHACPDMGCLRYMYPSMSPSCNNKRRSTSKKGDVAAVKVRAVDHTTAAIRTPLISSHFIASFYAFMHTHPYSCYH